VAERASLSVVHAWRTANRRIRNRQIARLLLQFPAAGRLRALWRLGAAIDAWWPEIDVLIEHRVSSARTEAANTSIKQIKRTGRGYRNPAHYQARILLTSANRQAA
jgi:transposase